MSWPRFVSHPVADLIRANEREALGRVRSLLDEARQFSAERPDIRAMDPSILCPACLDSFGLSPDSNDTYGVLLLALLHRHVAKAAPGGAQRRRVNNNK